MATVLVLLGLTAALVAFLYPRWKANSDRGGQKPAESFRIPGNLYYVGANDAAAFLVTGPEGHVLIDGGYPGTPPLIRASVAKLGFDIRDVEVLLNTDPHTDHAGGLAALQQASGAELWASEASVYSLASGGDDPDIFLPLRALVRTGIVGYPAARVDHRFEHGDTIRVGPIAITAHVTGGHTRGCTSYAFPIRDGGRVLNVVSACSLVNLGAIRLFPSSPTGSLYELMEMGRHEAEHGRLGWSNNPDMRVRHESFSLMAQGGTCVYESGTI
jgi:metallo-beta-lactamase class B